MDIRHLEYPAITLTFDEGLWLADTAAAARAAPLVIGGMGGALVGDTPGGARANPDFDWLVGQLSTDPKVSTRSLPELVRRPGAATRALDASTAPTVTVDLAPDESAVLLVECDGVVAWQFPEDNQPLAAGRTARGPGVTPARTARFVVQAPGTATATTAQQRNVFVDWMLDRVRSVVVKFVASHVAGAVVDGIEKDKRTGPVAIEADVEPAEWGRPDDYAALPLPNEGARILLFVHGTFSSTSGAFGDLSATRWGQALLKEAGRHYHAILGFDHRTISVEPSENAEQLYAALRTLRTQQPPTIDIVCHSRGALVTRWMIEKILPAAPWQPRIGKVVFVGATNAGTELARPENWHALVDLLTNLALAGRKALALMGAPQAGFAASELVKGIGDFVRYLVDAAIEEKRAPGLAAMDPDGEFVADINKVEAGVPTPADARYFVVSSNFRPVLVDAKLHEPNEFPRRLALMLANGFIGALMKREDNDLVVNVGSMSSIDPVAGKYVKEVKDFGTNPLVYHTNYFVHPETVDAVADWLGFPDVHAVEKVNAALVDTRIVVMDAQTRVADALREAEVQAADFVVVRRPDPKYPGTFHYAPSIDELRSHRPESPIVEALDAREFKRSPVVTTAPFLRSMSKRFGPQDPTLPNYSRRAVVMEEGKPVGVIAGAEPPLLVLRRATGMPDPWMAGVMPPGPLPDAWVPARAGSLDEQPAPSVAEPVVCNVQAEMPPRVQLGSTATVTVTLSADQVAAASDALSAHTPVKLEKRPVVVEVVPRRGFKLKSENFEDSRHTLTVPPAPGLPCVMDVQVVATDEGTGEIWAIVRQGPVRTATLQLQPQVVAAGPTTTGPPISAEGLLAADEDLPEVPTLEIIEQRNGDETRFRYGVYVPGELYDRFESPPIRGDIATWVKTLYNDIEGAWLGSRGNVEIFHDQLQARGASLFRELIPPPLAEALWRLRQEGKLTSVLVRSDEPFVPWEIAFLHDPSAAGNGHGCFLAQLGLCRWLYGTVFAARIRVRPGRIRYVVPHYPEPRYRLQAAEEVEELMLTRMGAEKIAPHYREVTTALQSGGFDLLHFAGHGGADGGNIAGAQVLLEGSFQPAGYVTEPLSADVVAQRAQLCGPDRNRPLVVLNACQVGRLGFNLTSLGGFAPAFLGARVGLGRQVRQAGAFVSSLWSVGDQPASVFGQAFYKELQVDGGTTIARAVSAAREAARAAGDATWLAYAVYAHPNCHVEFTP